MSEITLERIRNIAKDIIDDTEWVNDSHTKAEHNGIKDGLERLIRHLEEIESAEECVECGDFLNKIQDNMDERICMTCVLKKESPDVIRPSILTEERKVK